MPSRGRRQAFTLSEDEFSALVQEAIDVAVILNALRALGGADPNDAVAAPSSNAVREEV